MNNRQHSRLLFLWLAPCLVAVLALFLVTRQQEGPKSAKSAVVGAIALTPSSDESLQGLSSSASLEGRQPVALQRTDTQEQELDAGVIRGHVRFPASAAPPEKTLVAAWPVIRPPTSDEVRAGRIALVSDIRRLQVVVAGADGSFSFRGVRGQNYAFAAGCKGWVSAQASEAKPDSALIEISMEQLFGVAAEFQEASGDPLRCAPQLTRSVNTTVNLARGFNQVDMTARNVVLSGLDPLAATAAQPNRYTYLYAGPPFETPPPLEITCTFVGYETAVATVTLQPVATTIPLEAIYLTPTVKGWGSLTLRLRDGAATDICKLPPGRYKALVTMTPATGTPPISIRLFSVANGDVLIDGVPYGEYSIGLTGADRILCQLAPVGSASSLTTISNAPSVVEFSMANVGRAIIEFAGRDPEQEPLSVYAAAVHPGSEQGRNSKWGNFRFANKPYALETLPAGQYELRIEPVSRGEQTTPIFSVGTIAIGPQATTEVKVQWPR